MTKRLTGCGTALVTPFTKDGAVDEPALRKLVDWQLAEGIHMVVPCGSTGEAVTLTPQEHRRVVEITVAEVSGRVPVVAGAGSNDTKKAVALSKEMRGARRLHLLGKRHGLLRVVRPEEGRGAFQGDEGGGRHASPAC